MLCPAASSLYSVMKHGIELACPRVETGLLAVKAAVEPKNVVMAAILIRDCRGSEICRILCL